MRQAYTGIFALAATAPILWVTLHAWPTQAAPPAAQGFDAFRQVVLEELRERKVPGAAVAIIRGDSVVFAEGFGVADVQSREPVTPEMLFQVGSASKMFTAALVTTLAGERLIDLRTPVARYVTGLLPAIGARSAHDLLTHSGGLHDTPGGSGTQEESALAAYPRSWPADVAMLDAATVFSYSNPGYALLGALAAEVAGKAFADLVSDRVFSPLGMTRTTYRPLVALTYPAAVGHRASDGGEPIVVRPYGNDTRFWPAGYAFTSAREFARFASALMNAGRVTGVRGLSGSVVQAMMTPHVPVPNVFTGASYGYGLFVGSYRGHRSVWHDGQMPGFGAYVLLLPERHVGVVVMLNRENVRMERIVDAAFDALGVEQPAANPPRVKPALDMTPEEMSRYVGRYTNRLEVELVVRNGRLYRRWAGQEQPVYKVGDQRFTVDSLRSNPQSEFSIVPASASHPGYVHMFLWALPRRRD